MYLCIENAADIHSSNWNSFHCRLEKSIGNQQRQREMASTGTTRNRRGLTRAHKMFACWLKVQGYRNSDIQKAFEETFHVRLTSSTVATLTNPRNMEIMEHELMVTMTLSDWFQAIGIQSEDD